MTSFRLLDKIVSFVGDHIYSLMGWTIAIVAFVLIPFRRSAAEARSWLLVFFALPWIALIVYWLIGRPRYGKKRRERLKFLPAILERIADQTGIDRSSLAPQLSDDNAAVAKLVKGLGKFPALTGNNIELLSSYDAVYERIIDDIDLAQNHVHLQFYIFANDAVGDLIMAALERASLRGVSCRILIDALGSFGSNQQIKRRLRKSGVDVRDVLPLRRRWNSSRLDLRNHRKIVVVDGVFGYTGSQNLWDPTAHSRRPNRELFVRLSGPSVSCLQAVFVTDWYLETLEELIDEHIFPQPVVKPGVAAQILPTGPDFPDGGVDLVFVQAMYNAAKQVVIVTPYFIPNDALLAAIKSAVIAGVRVCLITTQRSDHLLVGLAQRSYYTELLSVGVEIYLYGPGFLHAKHFRIDHEVCVIGSSNVDLRSFELNAEVDLICFNERVTFELQQLENSYLTQSVPLNLDDWNKRPLVMKILQNSARLVGDLI